jgi:diguanylate cyclase (GGDEF)-like protein
MVKYPSGSTDGVTMRLPPPIQLSRFELWLLAISKRHGIRGFVFVVTACSVVLSLVMTTSLMVATGSSRANTIFAMAISVVVPTMVAPVASGVLARLLASLDRATAEMELLARTDSLTSLRNRRAFFGDATALLARSGVAASPAMFLAVMVDVDNFKTVNDVYGHSIGDKALLTLAENLNRAVHDDAVVGRLGGDEFAVVANATTPAAAAAVVERLRAACDLAEVVPGLRASLGSVVMSSPVDVDALLAAADRDLYEHKRAHPGER